MLDVSSFLLRWLFLCNLARDVADIQNLSYVPRGNSPFELQQQGILDNSARWRDFYLRGLMSYPPGTQRLLAIDALRIEVVHRLSQHLEMSRNILLRAAEWRRRQQCDRLQQQQQQQQQQQLAEHEQSDQQQYYRPNFDSSCWQQDAEIATYPHVFDQQVRGGETTTLQNTNADMLVDDDGTSSLVRPSVQQQSHQHFEQHQQHLESSYHRNATTATLSEPAALAPSDTQPPSAQEVDQARQAIRDLRDCLPQLVSIVLKSPQPFEPELSNPIQKLRQLIIQRCAHDASWGIELCWLLEAEVGRAWKMLFEHRQQTGRRLIVVLPAEKAVVLAEIGAERREAFDLLQDAEQATAYGYIVPPPPPPTIEVQHQHNNYHHHHQQQQLLQHQTFDSPYHTSSSVVSIHQEAAIASPGTDIATVSSRLPSSLSLRRCSHFGDTMQFVDRLTRISMDLRRIPITQRHDHLLEHLHEVNRRLRRRMVTRGDVSMDVEDNGGPDAWPQLSDVTLDMLQHSVHLPMEPKKVVWPNGNDNSNNKSGNEGRGGVVRVLNIIVSESRLLASRERCPYLIHVEVADTGLDGSDARLYALGASDLGATIEEALGMGPATVKQSTENSRGIGTISDGQRPAYEIPPELLAESSSSSISTASPEGNDSVALQSGLSGDDEDVWVSIPLARGGYQADDVGKFPPESTGYGHPTTPVHQEQYQQSQHHFQLQQERTTVYYQQTQLRVFNSSSAAVTVGHALLDGVFGTTWARRCEELRRSSAFGNVPGWRLASFIMKAGEDIRREALVMQVIAKLNSWFQTDVDEEHRPFMRPYTIMCVGGDAGIIECLSDAKSVDEIKKRTDGFISLRDYFERAYGPPRRRIDSPTSQGFQQSSPSRTMLTFEKAQDNFLRSLVGYSLVCYILQIKDRHNANILMDREGHIMHIDFGFVLGDTPKMGKVPIFSERAPFKLSADFWEVLGGWNFQQGGQGVRFCKVFERAFECAAAHADEIVAMVESSLLTLCPNPEMARDLANGVRSRLRMRGPPRSSAQKRFIVDLVKSALDSWGTSTYDWLQKSMNGYQ